MQTSKLSKQRDYLTDIVKNRRRELNITQSELSNLTGYHRNTIINFEKKRGFIGLEQFLAICHVLNMSIYAVPVNLHDEITKESNLKITL